MGEALIDSHCHLTAEPLAAQIDAVLERARAAGIAGMITIGCDPEDAARAAALAEREPDVFFAAGIHPHEAARFGTGAVADMMRFWEHRRCVAVGEIGLDYHYDFSPRQQQRRVFEALLEAARPTGLPIIIHCREAFDDCQAVLRAAGFEGHRVVFHCFAGSADQLRRLREAGWRASFTGIVTFRNSADLRRLAAEYPEDELMLETDAPYLSPEPVRHVRPNEPAHLVHTARLLADVRGVGLDDLAARTRQNTAAFFTLPL